MKKYLIYLKKPWFIALIAVVIIIAFFVFKGGSDSSLQFITVERGVLTEIVEVTGRVKSGGSVNLAFERSGRVSSVNFEIGDNVYAGAILASLENGDIRADLLQAEATLKSEEVKLDELKKGSREEELAISETKFENAKIALLDARETLVDKIRDAFIKTDDSIRNKADQLFSNPQGSNPKLNNEIIVNSSQLKVDIETGRLALEKDLIDWQNLISNSTSLTDFDTSTEQAKRIISSAKDFLDNMALVVNGLKPDSGLSQTTIDGYKADIFTARTNVSTANTNLSTAILALNTAESNLKIAENELKIAEEGGTTDQVLYQEARVDVARAGVSRYQAELLKTIIRAPISGVIGKVDLKKGETVSVGEPLISLISNNSYQIEVNVAEADIANLAVGQKAKVTLDAYSNNDIFSATVISINPSETIIEGVPTYETTLQFDEADTRIRPGMTADLDIITAEKEGVLSVPRRAIVENGGKKYLKILQENGEVLETEVTTGISGSEADVEIVSGLNEGDRVVTSIE